MAILFTEHALKRIPWRGTSVDEVTAVILDGTPDEARPGYEARVSVFPYERDWGGKVFPQKRVRAIFAREGDDIVVVTVYVYFGRWNE